QAPGLGGLRRAELLRAGEVAVRALDLSQGVQDLRPVDVGVGAARIHRDDAVEVRERVLEPRGQQPRPGGTAAPTDSHSADGKIPCSPKGLKD
ncbi:MAG: hypothetical protein ACK55I_25835, partial [bacterium]